MDEIQTSQHGLDQFVDQYTAAYEAHRAIYVLRFPQPQSVSFETIVPKPERELVQGTEWLVVGSLAVMVVASVIVSGSRTINEFGGGVIGFSAFAMLEVGIVAYAYIRTKKHYDESRHQSVKKLTNRGMWLAFIVTLAANLHATLKHNGVETAAWLDTAILILIAVSAPSLALIAGDVLGMEAVAGSAKQRKADERHAERIAEWNRQRFEHDAAHEQRIEGWKDGLNQAWNAQKSRMGIKQPGAAFAVHSVNRANEQGVLPRSLNGANGNGEHGTGKGYTKNMNAPDLLRDWLMGYHADHTEVWSMKTDDFWELAKREVDPSIKRTTAFNVRKALAEQQANESSE